MSDQQSGLIYLTGLWNGESKDGTEYLSGEFGTLRLVVFPNTRKQPGSNQPDWNAYLSQSSAQRKSADKTNVSTTTE